MVVNHPGQLGPKGSQGLVARVQAITQRHASLYSFLLGFSSFGQEMNMFHEGGGRLGESVHGVGVDRPVWRQLCANTVFFLPHGVIHLSSPPLFSLCFAALVPGGPPCIRMMDA